MKFSKIVFSLAVAAFLTLGLMAADTAKPVAVDKKAGCCVTAEKAGGACTHGCCVEAAKANMNCEKCKGTNAAKK